jgi:hypothetical protein
MIYFAQAVDGGPIKISCSQDIDNRLLQLKDHYGRPIALLATKPGDFDTEAEIHARFAHLRLGRTEQFRPAPELMEFIGRPLLTAPDPDAIEPMPPKNPRNEKNRQTYRLDPETLRRLSWIASYFSISETTAVKFAIAETFFRLSGEEVPVKHE